MFLCFFFVRRGRAWDANRGSFETDRVNIVKLIERAGLRGVCLRGLVNLHFARSWILLVECCRGRSELRSRNTKYWFLMLLIPKIDRKMSVSKIVLLQWPQVVILVELLNENNQVFNKNRKKWKYIWKSYCSFQINVFLKRILMSHKNKTYTPKKALQVYLKAFTFAK